MCGHRPGFDVQWSNGPALFGEVRATFDVKGRREDEIIKRLVRAKVLYLSDLLPPGNKLTDYQASITYQVIDARYSDRKPTWLTLNVATRAEMEAGLGAAIVDRVVDGALVLACNWPSYRKAAQKVDELMHVSWDMPNTITPEWKRGRLPVLRIPAELQKNATEEDIPLLPWLESVLLETPENERTGWAFNPASLQEKVGRKARHGRVDAEWVGKIISRIGEAAGVIVEAGDERTGKPVKYASAHDLRRSCAERLQDAGIPPLVICRVLRHASWETTRKHYAPGNVQRDAGILRERLASVPACTWVQPADTVDVNQYPRQDSDLRPTV